MIINQTISNLKENGVEFNPPIYRQVKSAMLQCFYDNDNEIAEVIVTCDVRHYTDVEMTKAWGFNPRVVKNLHIKDTFTVDKTTGVRATEDTLEENKMGELTFFVDYSQMVIRQGVAAGVYLADINHRFD